MLNAVCVDINWRLAPPEVAYIVNDAEAKVLVVGQDFVPVLDAIADQLTTVKKIVVIGGHADATRTTTSWVARHAAIDPGVRAGVRRRRVPALLLGHDRAAEGRDAHQRQLLRAAARWRWRCGGFTPDSVNMVAMPLFHIGGGGWAVAGMYAAAPSVLVRDLDPAALVELIGRRGITHALPRPRGAAVHADGAGRRGRRLLEPRGRSSTARRPSRRRCWRSACARSAASSGRRTA